MRADDKRKRLRENREEEGSGEYKGRGVIGVKYPPP